MSAIEGMERRLWHEGAAAFDELLADDALVVVPMEPGILDRDACLDTIADAPRWTSVILHDARETHPGEGLRLLSYRAEAVKEDRRFLAWCSSLWRETDAGWRLVHHQQTPVPE